MSNLICAGILSQDGRILVRRAFIDDNSKIEVSSSSSLEHTLVNFDNIRFIFQSIDQVYLFLASNKNSNIIEDHDTLSGLAKIVTYAVGGTAVDERSVTESMFDIIFAWDEAISNGLSNHLMTEEISVYCGMHSQEEEALLQERKRKEYLAKAYNAEKMRELDEMRTGYVRPSNPVLSVLSQVLNRISGEGDEEMPKGHIGDASEIRKTGASATSESYERERKRTSNISTTDPFTGQSFKETRRSRKRRSGRDEEEEEDGGMLPPSSLPQEDSEEEELQHIPRRTMNLRSRAKRGGKQAKPGKKETRRKVEEEEEEEAQPSPLPEEAEVRESDAEEEEPAEKPRKKKKTQRRRQEEEEDNGDDEVEEKPAKKGRARRAREEEEEDDLDEEEVGKKKRPRKSRKEEIPSDEDEVENADEEEEEEEKPKRKPKKSRRQEVSDDEEGGEEEEEEEKQPVRKAKSLKSRTRRG